MPNTIIGRGMMAQAFTKSASDNCIFFCSGVSDSRETDVTEFYREVALFKKTKKTKILVYFSSYIAEVPMTPYALHKKNMEYIVKSTCQNY